MVRVEVTLKSGALAVFQTDSISKRQSIAIGGTTLSWGKHGEVGVPSLLYLAMEEVAAVIIYKLGSPDSQGAQDERDGEEAKAGGDQVEPGGDIEGRDAE